MRALLTPGKLLAVAIIIVAGFILGAGLPEHFAAGAAAREDVTGRRFLLALVAGLFACGGWPMVTYSLDLSEADRAAVLGGNAARLLGLRPELGCRSSRGREYFPDRESCRNG